MTVPGPSTTGPTLVWFRHDLRLTDNPAWEAAGTRGELVVPVFVWSPEDEQPWQPGGAARWWLHHALTDLQHRLAARGLPLLIRRGPAETVLPDLVRETLATRVVWNRRYEPHITARDTRMKQTLKERGVEALSFNGSLLFEPWEIETGSRTPYRVFTPFYRACLAKRESSLAADPADGDRTKRTRTDRAHSHRETQPASLPIASLKLLPSIPWDAEFATAWKPGETEAERALQRFLTDSLDEYATERDRPDHSGTSRLSPYLHTGELSPRQIWTAVEDACGEMGTSRWARAEPYLRQLVWRDFAHHLLYHFPATPESPLQAKFDAFPWRDDAVALRAWQRGETGYPIVDAGMRQLWRTGWMHNRVRMIVGSFLVKDLLLSWREGAKWFWDTLVDADLANNTLGWQWIGGCGADAAPYFRVFNPLTQSEKFDPDGTYIRRYVPELEKLPTSAIHAPWKAPATVLKEAGIRLGRTYPAPIVDHAEARARALAAWSSLPKS